MTATSESSRPSALPPIPPPPSLRADWGRGLRSLRALLRESDDTEKAVDFFWAVGRVEFEKNFQRFLSSWEGRRLLNTRPSLSDALSDRSMLSRLAEQSFGRAYLRYLDQNAFQPTALIELQERVEARWLRESDLPPSRPSPALVPGPHDPKSRSVSRAHRLWNG